MEIKIRDWFVLIMGVALVILGGFQIAYNLESFQVKDFIIAGVGLLVYAWLHYQHKYKNNNALFDEYYLETLYKSIEYGLAIILVIIWFIIFMFKTDGMISVNYIYGAIRLGVGVWLLYFSYLVMRENSYE